MAFQLFTAMHIRETFISVSPKTRVDTTEIIRRREIRLMRILFARNLHKSLSSI